MNKESFEYICQCQMVLTSIPTRFYHNNNLIKRYESHKSDFDLVSKYLDDLLSTQKDVDVILSQTLLMYGIVRHKDTGFAMVLGPVRSVIITNEVAKQIVLSNNLNLSQTEAVKNFLNEIRGISIENFFIMLSQINTYINNEIVQVYEIYNDEFPENTKSNVYSNLLTYLEEAEDDDLSMKHFSNEFEKMLVFYIKNGMIDQLHEYMISTYRERQGSTAFDAMRNYKNRAISFITIISRAAIDGGANPAICYQLADLYCQNVELCQTVPKMHKVLETMIDDFSNRVKSYINFQTEDPIINKVLQYIDENISHKLKVSDIAEKFNTNNSYLSVKFNKLIGIPLSKYIVKQKINEAKRLLKFSDKQLIEISNYLSFSSQSHFQNQFKSITNMTPLEYRKSTEQ